MYFKYLFIKYYSLFLLIIKGIPFGIAKKMIFQSNYNAFKEEMSNRELTEKKKEELFKYWSSASKEKTADYSDCEKTTCYLLEVKLPVDDFNKMSLLNSLDRLVSIIATDRFPYAMLVFENENDAKGGRNVLRFNNWETYGDISKQTIARFIMEEGLQKNRENIKPFDAFTSRLFTKEQMLYYEMRY